jgi:hypothetical protein
MSDPFDLIRIVNLVALGLVALGLIVSAIVYRDKPLNLKAVVLFLFVVSGIYGTAEALYQPSTPGARAVFVLVVAVIGCVFVYVPLFESFVAYQSRRKNR